MLKAPVVLPWMPLPAGKAVGASRPRLPLIAATTLRAGELPGVVGTTAQLAAVVISLMITASPRPPDGSRGLAKKVSPTTLVFR